MTKDDALELIERMPYIPAFVISNERNRLSALRAAQKSDDPVEWIKVVKTIYICRNDPKTGRRIRLFGISPNNRGSVWMKCGMRTFASMN